VLGRRQRRRPIPLHRRHRDRLDRRLLAGRPAPPGTLQSNVFQIALSPDGHTLYAISQSTDPTGSFADGNQLHILSVARNGTLSEPNGPILLSTAGVPGDAHPQGIAVVTIRGHARGFEGGEQHGHERTEAIDFIHTNAAAIPSSSNFRSETISKLDVSDLAIALAHLRQQSNSAD
jgi:hypothetical protein